MRQASGILSDRGWMLGMSLEPGPASPLDPREHVALGYDQAFTGGVRM